jgi:hypothetical protein
MIPTRSGIEQREILMHRPGVMAYERASRIRANGHLETIERRPGWERVRWQGQSGISSVLSVRAPCPLAAVA